MAVTVSRKMRFLVFLTCLASHARALSVVPSLTHIPAGVRAACRTTLAKNITQCSDEFEKELQFIPSTSLPQICTTECAGALSALYTEALSRCGTDSVDVMANDTVLATFTPIDVVGHLRYIYNSTCLQDKDPSPPLFGPRENADVLFTRRGLL
jgi:hypothetical protein